MPLIEVLAAMEQTGVLLDQKRLADIGEGFEQRIETLQAEIFELAGHEFTIGSPQQLAEVLFDELGLTKKRRGKTGFSTDARVLSQIREEHEIVAKVEQWRELTKLKSTYLDALPELIDPDTGRLHTTFNQTATATGRLSSTNPNLQNIPIRTEEGRPIRSCFVAPRGQRLLSADYNQIELRILAHIAGEDALREIFARGEDIHAATAAEVLGVDPEEGQPRRALEGEDGQLRHRLRALRLRPRRPAQHRAGRGRLLHRALLRALPGGQALHRGDDRVREGERLRQHPARPPPPDPRAPLRPPPGPQPGRAPRGQHADPGHLGGHHQDRDGRAATRHSRSPTSRRAWSSRSTTSSSSRARGRRWRPPPSWSSARCAGPSTSIRRWRSTSASARTGSPPSSGRVSRRDQGPISASSSSASSATDGPIRRLRREAGVDDQPDERRRRPPARGHRGRPAARAAGSCPASGVRKRSRSGRGLVQGGADPPDVGGEARPGRHGPARATGRRGVPSTARHRPRPPARG